MPTYGVVTAEENQREVEVPFTFPVGIHSLRVHYNGQELISEDDYLEILGDDGEGSGKIEMTFNLKAGDKLAMDRRDVAAQAASVGGAIVGSVGEVVVLRMFSPLSSQGTLVISIINESGDILVDTQQMNPVGSIQDLWEFVWQIPALGRFTALALDTSFRQGSIQYVVGLVPPEGSLL